MSAFFLRACLLVSYLSPLREEASSVTLSSSMVTLLCFLPSLRFLGTFGWYLLPLMEQGASKKSKVSEQRSVHPVHFLPLAHSPSVLTSHSFSIINESFLLCEGQECSLCSARTSIFKLSLVHRDQH